VVRGAGTKHPISQREGVLVLPLNFNQRRPLAATRDIGVVSLSSTNNAAETVSTEVPPRVIFLPALPSFIITVPLSSED